jgi:hypothetical protein
MDGKPTSNPMPSVFTPKVPKKVNFRANSIDLRPKTK